MDKNILVVVTCLDKDVVACLDNNNNKDDFNVNFLLARPLVYLLEGILGGQCILHRGYINKIVWSETYVRFSHDHEYKTQ